MTLLFKLFSMKLWATTDQFILLIHFFSLIQALLKWTTLEEGFHLHLMYMEILILYILDK